MSPTRIRAGVQDLPNGARLQIPEDLNFDWAAKDPTPPEINLSTESTTPQFPVGTQLRTPSGLWRYIKAGGTTGVGKLVSQEAAVAANDNLEVNAAAVGAVELTFITDSLTFAAGELVGGTVHIETGTGIGPTYEIIKNTVVSSATGMVVTLSSMTPVSVAIGASNNEMTLTKSKYMDCIITASPTVTNPVGVVQFVAADGDYGWIKTSGQTAVLTDASAVPIVGEPAIPSVNTDGAVGPLVYANTSAVEIPHIGIVTHVGGTSEYSNVDLKNLDF